MTQSFSKDKLKLRFEKSLSTYDENAIVQNEMADYLLKNLSKYAGLSFAKILELGAGTGLMTRKMLGNITFEEFYANDIVEKSEEYINKINEKIKFIAGDIEQIEFPSNLDLIIANAVFQWTKDFPALVAKLASCLKPDGIVAYTSFGPDNLLEINKILNISLPYYNFAEEKQILSKHFEILFCENCRIELKYNTPIDILRHLENSGVNCLGSGSWTKSDLKSFDESYRALFKDSESLVLTYNPTYFVLKRK